MKLLIVAYHFPPDAEIGGVRPYQFARYLRDHGIETRVLTVDPRFAEAWSAGFEPVGLGPDATTRTEVGASPSVLTSRAIGAWKHLRTRLGASAGRAEGPRPTAPSSPKADEEARRRRDWMLSWIEFPDRRIGWYLPAVRAGRALAARESFDAVFSTAPPRTAHLVAASIARSFNLPWIMDLRDPWYKPTLAGWGSPTVERLHRRLFRRYAKLSRALVVNTERMRRSLLEEEPDLAARLHCVPNGCGFDGTAPAMPAPRGGPLAIGYFGQLFPGRSTTAFLEGVRLWLDRTKIQANMVSITFVGAGSERIAPEVARLGMEGVVACKPPVPRSAVEGLMAEQFALLLIATGQPLQVPGKAYDYLAASRRLLAVTEREGATADLLAGVPDCSLVDSPEAAAKAIAHLYGQHREGASPHVDRRELLARHHYRERAADLAAIIRAVVRERAREGA